MVGEGQTLHINFNCLSVPEPDGESSAQKADFRLGFWGRGFVLARPTLGVLGVNPGPWRWLLQLGQREPTVRPSAAPFDRHVSVGVPPARSKPAHCPLTSAPDYLPPFPLGDRTRWPKATPRPTRARPPPDPLQHPRLHPQPRRSPPGSTNWFQPASRDSTSKPANPRKPSGTSHSSPEGSHGGWESGTATLGWCSPAKTPRPPRSPKVVGYRTGCPPALPAGHRSRLRKSDVKSDVADARRRPHRPARRKRNSRIARKRGLYGCSCTLDRDRTCNLQLRRLTLYPIELRGHASSGELPGPLRQPAFRV
jgi:hypothetical protein